MTILLLADNNSTVTIGDNSNNNPVLVIQNANDSLPNENTSNSKNKEKGADKSWIDYFSQTDIILKVIISFGAVIGLIWSALKYFKGSKKE